MHRQYYRRYVNSDTIMCVAGNRGSVSEIYYSYNGKVWNLAYSFLLPLGGNAFFSSMIYGNGIFVAIGPTISTFISPKSKTTYVYYSNDGINWTRNILSTYSGIVDLNTYDYMVRYIKETGLFVIASMGRVYYSSDGENWSYYDFTGGASGKQLYDIRYDTYYSRYYACGDGVIVYSSDLISWTEITNYLTPPPINLLPLPKLTRITMDNLGNIIITSDVSTVHMGSTNGTTFSNIISLPTSSLINDVTYKENLGAFVVVGATTSSEPTFQYSTSANFPTFTVSTSGSMTEPTHIFSFRKNGSALIVGKNGKITNFHQLGPIARPFTYGSIDFVKYIGGTKYSFIIGNGVLYYGIEFKRMHASSTSFSGVNLTCGAMDVELNNNED